MLVTAPPLPRLVRFGRSLACWLLAGFLSCALPAATLTMPNGEVLRGSVISATEQTIVFQSDSFGRLTVARTPAVKLDEGATAVTAASPTPATKPGAAGSGEKPAPALIQKVLGLSDKWSTELQVGVAFVDGEMTLRSYETEATIGYKTPPHEFGLFGSYHHQKLNGQVVGEGTEFIGRYFYVPDKSKWILVSQADWMRDTTNLIDYRADFIAVPAYRLLNEEHMRFVIGAGPSYRTETRLISSGDDLIPTDADSFRVAFYQVFNWDIHPHLTLRETLLSVIDPRDTNNIGVRLDITLSQAITEHTMLNLEYSYILDRNPLFEDQDIGTLNIMGGYSF